MSRSSSLLQHLLTIRQFTTEKIIRVFRLRGLLLNSLKCAECNETMIECERPNHMDEYRWRCMTGDCSKYQHSISIRHGSFFRFFCFPLKEVWTIVVCWLRSIPIKTIVEMFGYNEGTVINVITHLRRLAKEALSFHASSYNIHVRII